MKEKFQLFLTLHKKQIVIDFSEIKFKFSFTFVAEKLNC